METIMNLPWAEIAGIVALLILVFDRIAKLTPTETDDKVVEAVYRIASVLGLRFEDNPGKKAS